MPFGLPSLERGLSNERKFVGDELLTQEAHRILSALCLPDGEHPEGLIRSLYFDSPTLDSYGEKANGDNLKLKIRLRWYDEDNTQGKDSVPVFLEAKGRVGSARNKVRVVGKAPASLVKRAPLDSQELAQFVRRLGAEHEIFIPAGWMPAMVVAYRRTRYICPSTGSRIALDRDIAAPRFNPLMFPAAIPAHLATSLVEYKNDGGEPPPWAQSLFAIGYRLRSFSKYATLADALRNGGQT